MHSGTSRRFFIALGVARYENLDDGAQLKKVDDDVRGVRALFTSFGYQSVLEGLGSYESADQIRKRIKYWARDAALTEDDIVAFYFAGHAYVPDRDRHYLYCWDTEEDSLSSSALATEDLVRVLCEGPLRRLLLVLDTCMGGAGGADAATVALNSLAHRHNGSDVSTSLCFLSSARPKDLALEGAFSGALADAVELSTQRAGQRQAYLDLSSLVQYVNDHFADLGIAQRAELAKGSGTGLDPFLPNGSYRTDLPAEGTDLDFQHQAIEIAEHYGPRSRGVEFESEQGRYFSGRKKVLRELVTWMNDPRGDGRGRTVTGKPGCGKSALLGRIVTVSDPEYRSRLDLDAVPDDTLVSEGTVAAAVHARHKRLEEVVERLAFSLGARQQVPSAAGLLQEVAQRAQNAERPVVIVVDALDEAGSGTSADIRGKGEPRRIARELLRPLAEIPGVRLLVGTRRELVKALGSAMKVLDLDDYPTDSREDIQHYVERVLAASDETDIRTPYQGRPELTRKVARGIAARADGVFLVGRLTARSLRRQEEPINTSRVGWAETLPSAVGEAFDDYLGRFGEQEDRVRRILTPLAFAEGQGLPQGSTWVAMVRGLFGEECAEADISGVLNSARDYVAEVTEGQRSVYRLYHQALADHLRESYTREPVRAQERMVAALLETVPNTIEGQGPDWFAASVYVRSHLATHAADTKYLDELVADPVFLLAAKQLPLLKVMGRTCGEEARVARTAYEQIAHRLSEEDFPLRGRVADLQLSARRCGADLLAERIDKAGLPMSWRTKWAWWSTSGAHRQLVGHTDWVVCVATMVLDGQLVAVTGGDDRTLRIWDLSTQSQLGESLQLPVDPTCITLGEIGEYSIALVGGIDGQLQLVDLSTNRFLGEPLSGHTNLIQDVSMTNFRGRPYALTSSQDGTARLWDLIERCSLGHPLEAHRSSVRAASLATVDDSLIGVTGGADRKVYVWDLTPVVEDPTVQTRGEAFLGHTATVTALHLHNSNSGPIVLSGDDEGTLNRWSPNDLQQLGEPVFAHPHPMPNLAGVVSIDVGDFDGKRIVLTNGVEYARVWDLETMRQHGHPLRGHVNQQCGSSLACHGRENYAVTASWDRTARVWDLAAERPQTGHVESINTVASVTHKGRSYAATGGSEGFMCVWDLDELRGITPPLEGHQGAIEAVALCSLGDDLVVLTGGEDATLRMWLPLRDRECVTSISGHTNTVTCLRTVVLDGRRLVLSGSEDGTIRLWDLATWEEVTAPLKGQVGGVRELDARVDAGVLHVVVQTTRDYVYLWRWTGLRQDQPELVTERREEMSKERASPIGVGFVRSRAVVLTADFANSIRCFDVEQWKQVGSNIEGWGLFLQRGTVMSIDTRTLVSSLDAEDTLRLWDLDTGKAYGHPMQTMRRQAVVTAEFAWVDRELGLLAIWGKQARLWSVKSSKPVGDAFSGIDYNLRGVCVGESGTVVTTSSGDGVIRTHETETGRQVAPLLPARRIGGLLRVDGKGRHIAQRWGDLEVYDLEERRLIGVCQDGDATPKSTFVLYEIDGRTLAVSTSKGACLNVWDLEEFRRIGNPLVGHTAEVHSLGAFKIEDTHVLVSASADGTVRTWDLNTREALSEPLRGDGYGFCSVDIGRLGSCDILVAGDVMGSLFAWNPQDWSKIPLPIPSFDNPVSNTCLVQVGQIPLIVAADATGVVRIWNYSIQKVTGEIGVGSMITDLTVTSNGELYAATTMGLVALRLDLESLSGL